MSIRNRSRAVIFALVLATGGLSARAGSLTIVGMPARTPPAVVPASDSAPGLRSASAPVLVAADVQGQCRIGVENLNFGVYDPLDGNAQSDLVAESVIACTCTKGSRASIFLDAGKSAANPMSDRHMAAGLQQITYQLYRDPQRSAVWNGPGQEQTIRSTTGRSASLLRIYGSIPSGQRVLAGEYSDTITAIVEF